MLSLEQYTVRVKSLAEQCGLSTKDLVQIIEEELPKYPTYKEKSKRTYFTWAKGIKFFPPIETVNILANTFGVNVGYLIGQHPVMRFDDRVPEMNIDMDLIATTFREEHKYSIWKQGVNFQWAHTLNTDKPVNTRPFYRFATTLNYTVDFCLGQTAVKYWQQYAYDNEMYELLPANTIFVLPGENINENEFLLLSDVFSKTPKAINKEGKIHPLKTLKEKGAKIVLSTKY